MNPTISEQLTSHSSPSMSFFKKIAKEFEDLGLGGKDKEEKKEGQSHSYGGNGENYRGGHESYGGSSFEYAYP